MDATKFGAFVQSQRKVLSLTQAQLGEKLGVTDKAISRWEKGEVVPSIDVLEQLAEIYNVKISYFFEKEEHSFKISIKFYKKETY